MKYAIRVMLLFFILVLAHTMTEKQILSLILVSVISICWHCMDKENDSDDRN